MPTQRDAEVSMILSVAFFLAGLALAYFLNLSLPLVSFKIMPAIDLLLLSLAVLVFSMLLFGKLTPLFFILVGLSQAGMLRAMPLLVLLYAIPLFIMGFVGTFFGMLLLEDMNGNDNLYNYKKELLKWFAVGAAAAIIIGLLDTQLLWLNETILYAVSGIAK